MEMGKGAVTVTQDIQNVEKSKLNNHQPKIWEVTSTLSPVFLSSYPSITSPSSIFFPSVTFPPLLLQSMSLFLKSLSPSNISTYFALSYSPFFNLSHTINQF